MFICAFKFLQRTAASSSSLLHSASLRLWSAWRWQRPSSSVNQTLCWLTGTCRGFSPNQKVVYTVEKSPCTFPVILKPVGSLNPNFPVCWQLQTGSSTTPTSVTSIPAAGPVRQQLSPCRSFRRNWRLGMATLCTSEAETTRLEKVWRRSFLLPDQLSVRKRLQSHSLVNVSNHFGQFSRFSAGCFLLKWVTVGLCWISSRAWCHRHEGASVPESHRHYVS